MTQEEKQLLLVDLCGRLPYDVIVRCYFVDGGGEEVLDTDDIADMLYNDEDSEFPMYKPYLRPLSSMTDEEEEEYNGLLYGICDFTQDISRLTPITELTTFFNSHHLDYRGLIEKGLAIEAPEGMYNTKTE